ncbi:hypothetical protein Cgig2_011770 [Carnegiea gigantea]|uniref:Uncharacterized protein n=1 Tax=Carnegiea gigantea TaxID=171969 RepID=A0A9Q1JU41_9CARY|nr:hypothetical protein Cgig2_011770 [Carnegiea gigantea]
MGDRWNLGLKRLTSEFQLCPRQPNSNHGKEPKNSGEREPDPRGRERQLPATPECKIKKLFEVLATTAWLEERPRKAKEQRGYGKLDNGEDCYYSKRLRSSRSSKSLTIFLTTFAISKPIGRRERGKYECIVVDIKMKIGKSKLKVCLPNEVLRAIGELLWLYVIKMATEESFSFAGKRIWKEVQSSQTIHVACLVHNAYIDFGSLIYMLIISNVEQQRTKKRKISQMIFLRINRWQGIQRIEFLRNGTRENNNVKPTTDKKLQVLIAKSLEESAPKT